MKKIFITIFISLFLISLASAQSLDSLGTYKQGEKVRITQVCADASYVNISSVSYPNSSIASSNMEMASAGSGEFYFDFYNTSTFGRHDVRGISDGCDKTFATYFDVTPSGTKVESALSIPFLLPIVLMIIVALFSFSLTAFFEKKEYRFVMFIFGGFFLVLSIVFGIISSRETLYGFPLLYSFISSFYRIFLTSLVVGVFIMAVAVTFFVIKRAFSSRGYSVLTRRDYRQ